MSRCIMSRNTVTVPAEDLLWMPGTIGSLSRRTT